jgi:hypothetical protein
VHHVVDLLNLRKELLVVIDSLFIGAVVPMIRERTSFSNPFIMERMKSKAVTPIRMPPIEIRVMTETNLVFRLERRYRLAMKNSYDTMEN